MTEVLARDLGQTLHQLIADLEPARWTDDKRARLSSAFSGLTAQLDTALAQWPEEDRLASVRARLDEIHEILRVHTPSATDLQTRWMEFRGEIHAAYEALAVAMKSCHMELPHVRPTNYVRSGFHVLSGLVALLIVETLPWTFVVAIPVTLAALGWFLELMRRYSAAWNDFLMKALAPIAHPHERFRINSSTWFTTSLALLALTFEPVVAAIAVTVLGFGDPFAALVGRKYGRTKLINNRSLEGTAAFALVSFVACMAVLTTWHGALPLATKLALASIPALAGALVELFSRRIDDNLTIPLSAGAAAWVVLALLS